MKNQALFSSKDKSKKLKCRQLQFLFGALRINKQIWTDFFSFKFHKMLLTGCLVTALLADFKSTQGP